MLWAMNLHALHRPSLQRVIFGREYSPSQSFFARFRLVLSDALIMTSLIVELSEPVKV